MAKRTKEQRKKLSEAMKKRWAEKQKKAFEHLNQVQTNSATPVQTDEEVHRQNIYQENARQRKPRRLTMEINSLRLEFYFD